MATASLKLWDIYEGLKNNFLFNSDVNSIYVLLALYDLEENISNIYPKYITTKKIKRRLKYVFKNRENADVIAHNISLLLHEDVNRLELCFYLEGYKYGFSNAKWVNRLEEKTIKKHGLEFIYKSEYLFHFNCTDKEVRDIQLKVGREIDALERNNKYLEDLVYTFSDKVIKNKLKNIDKYIDKQLKMDFNPYDFSIKEECYKLKKDELDKVYKSVVSVLIKNLKKIYKEACWYAINDKVLKRYV
ncbi:hypothetical protein [Caldisalinibacter kiritimatiensis]|uniref:Uncharacterized protein n=1 Tax=Caldisalinibacter kiritimatiensis TaxID=1304284 RepID=R1AU40_9FIRM|nr:hypothetical protein [Caldisalinibacter kiritimatiensis]EOD00678.1 hypothetical protein L21TH_1279 [Caldisalinibacter kiritimatiensis]